MYEPKKNGKAFTSKFVGTGPSSFKKKNLPGRGLTNLRNTDLENLMNEKALTHWGLSRQNQKKQTSPLATLCRSAA